MKKSLLAAAVLSAASFGAYADGVELYGIADVALVNISSALTPDSNFGGGISMKSGVKGAGKSSVSALLSGGIQGSRWGIKGSEDLGDGLKAVFQLESGININNGVLQNSAQSLLDSKADTSVFGSNGSTNGQLFNRTANVGLSNAELGTIKFGRNYVFMYDIYDKYDPVQFAALFTPVGASGTYSGGNGVSENLRQDNSIKYTGKMGDINYGAMYKLGNTAGSTSQGSAYGFNLGYEKGAFGVQAAYQGATDAVKASGSSSTAVALTVANTNAFLIAVKYKLNDALTAKVNFQRWSLSTASDPSFVTTSSLYNNITVASVSQVGATQSSNLSSIGGEYAFSDKLKLNFGYYSFNADAYATQGGVTGANAYTENYASALLDYNLSKRTDVYLGGMQVTTNQSGYYNNNVVAAGMRHKF